MLGRLITAPRKVELKPCVNRLRERFRTEVTVNCVAPGFISTEMTDVFLVN